MQHIFSLLALPCNLIYAIKFKSSLWYEPQKSMPISLFFFLIWCTLSIFEHLDINKIKLNGMVNIRIIIQGDTIENGMSVLWSNRSPQLTINVQQHKDELHSFNRYEVKKVLLTCRGKQPTWCRIEEIQLQLTVWIENTLKLIL